MNKKICPLCNNNLFLDVSYKTIEVFKCLECKYSLLPHAEYINTSEFSINSYFNENTTIIFIRGCEPVYLNRKLKFSK